MKEKHVIEEERRLNEDLEKVRVSILTNYEFTKLGIFVNIIVCLFFVVITLSMHLSSFITGVGIEQISYSIESILIVFVMFCCLGVPLLEKFWKLRTIRDEHILSLVKDEALVERKISHRYAIGIVCVILFIFMVKKILTISSTMNVGIGIMYVLISLISIIWIYIMLYSIIYMRYYWKKYFYPIYLYLQVNIYEIMNISALAILNITTLTIIYSLLYQRISLITRLVIMIAAIIIYFGSLKVIKIQWKTIPSTSKGMLDMVDKRKQDTYSKKLTYVFLSLVVLNGVILCIIFQMGMDVPAEIIITIGLIEYIFYQAVKGLYLMKG